MTKLQEQIDYEEEVLIGFTEGGKKIPEQWSIERQQGFVAGMKHAQFIINNF